MSLVGLRNLSLIETAPINRYPIQTYVIEENDQLIKDAVLKEKARGGQSFILYNRVDSIDYEKEKLQKLMPDISIAIGHGQLSKTELESTIELSPASDSSAFELFFFFFFAASSAA